MSVLHRARARLLVCCVAAVAAVGAVVFVPAAGAANLVTGSTYLALGDSLTYGYHAAQFAKEYPAVNPANYEEGFVNDFGADLKVLQPKLQIDNLGCPGETTETFLNGPGAPYTGGYCAGGPTGSPFPFSFLHHPYTHNTQMEEAEAILKANPDVSPITLDMGANDILQFLEHHCGFPSTYTCTELEVIGELGHIAINVNTIAEKLHALDTRATIVIVGQYNPYPAVLPKPGADTSAAGYNSFLQYYASKIPGAVYADPLPRFNPGGSAGGYAHEYEDIPSICAYTAMCPGGTFNPASPEADIHPTTLGYAVLAESISSLFGPTGATGSAGATGPAGAEGPQGPEGPQGAQGPEGPQGPAGATGEPGATGVAGATGPAGPAGATGPAGPAGPAGAAGAQGVTGATGAQGATGPAGANGSNGSNGSNGATGPAGPAGPAGAAGAAGATGPAGAAGTAGATGPAGPAGAAGTAGATGPAGPAGAAGAKGTTGATGAAGPTGSTGATGASGSNIVGGGFGGIIWTPNWFTMSLYAQVIPTPMIQAGTMEHFAVHFTANVNTNTTLVVEKNGVPTSITCTVPKNSNSCSDNTHTAAFAASDLVLVKATYSGSLRATNPSWSAIY
jgi:lysophospholipase L1-like esterase